VQRWKLKVVPVSDLTCVIGTQDKTVGEMITKNRWYRQ